MRIAASVSGIALSLIVSIPVALGNEGDSPRLLRIASEVRVEQAHGSMPTGYKPIDVAKSSKSAPEGSTNAAGPTGPTAPVTCNQQNASSPACYSATQQARPAGR
jgi:hypothetical protein